MAYLLRQQSLNKTIIKIGDPNDWMTVNNTGLVWGDVGWLNVNVKYAELAGKFTGGVNAERDVAYKNRGDTLNFRLINQAGQPGISGDNGWYVLNGFYEGGRFIVTQSANDVEIQGGTGLTETAPNYFLTYSYPYIEGGSNANSPAESNANNSNFSITVQNISKPQFSNYEYFTLRYELQQQIGSSWNTVLTGVAVNNVNNLQETKRITQQVAGADIIPSTNKRPEIIIVYGNYYWNITGYNNVKNIIPKQYDRTLMRLRFYLTSHKNDGTQTYTATNSYYYYLKVYYRPINRVEGVTLKSNTGESYGNKTASSTSPTLVTNDETLSHIKVSWSYDTAVKEAGVTQGYQVNIYDYNKKLIKQYYTDTKSIDIPKSDIPRLGNTYISVIPYFKNDSSYVADYWYQKDISMNDNYLILPFVRLVAELKKPVITYPVMNSDWINHKFRVCFELPEDLDYEYVEQENGIGSYRYENIEIDINGSKILALTGSSGISQKAIIKPQAFSCLESKLTYKRNIIIYPDIDDDIIHTQTYTVRVRVKKKYGSTDESPRWSAWSDKVVFTVTPITYNYEKHQPILAIHFNKALNNVDRVRKTYGVQWNNKQNNAIANSTIIQGKQYIWENLFCKVYETKLIVNKYGEFDTGRENVKFDISNNVMSKSDVLNTVWVINEKIYCALPNISENILHTLPNISENILHTLPNFLDETHYVTAEKDDDLQITKNKDDLTGIETVIKPGKNYIQYSEDNCNFLV